MTETVVDFIVTRSDSIIEHTFVKKLWTDSIWLVYEQFGKSRQMDIQLKSTPIQIEFVYALLDDKNCTHLGGQHLCRYSVSGALESMSRI